MATCVEKNRRDSLDKTSRPCNKQSLDCDVIKGFTSPLSGKQSLDCDVIKRFSDMSRTKHVLHDDVHVEPWMLKGLGDPGFKEGFTIVEEGEEDTRGYHDYHAHGREYLDIAAGAQIYMEKQRVHVSACMHVPVYVLWHVLWLVIRSPLYAPSVVKPTLRMPVLLFRKSFGLFRLRSYLYIRCSATSLKAYGKIWLMPGTLLNLPSHYLPTWLTTLMNMPWELLCAHWRKVFYAAVIQPLKWSSHLLAKPFYYADSSKAYAVATCENGVRDMTRQFHELNLKCPTNFPILLQYRTRFTLYKAIPSRTLSRLWGQFNQLELPVWMRTHAFGLYIWMFGCKLHEAEVTDLTQYRNLCEFFTRRLKPGVRSVHGSQPLVSPADGTVLYCGKVQDDNLEQIKGVYYSMQSFMGPLSSKIFSLSSTKQSTKHSTNHSATQKHQHMIRPSSESALVTMATQHAHLQQRKHIDRQIGRIPRSCLHTDGNAEERRSEEFNVQHLKTHCSPYSDALKIHPHTELQYCIIYLAPGDYHRFHSPATWTVHSRRHFSGELFSVRPRVAQWLQGLFCINERAMYVGEWKYGFFSFTAVGATNVGSIQVAFDKELQTSVHDSGEVGYFEDKSFRNSNDTKKRSKNGIRIHKGQDIGHFNLGSTIVLVYEAPPSFKLHLKPGQNVKYGQGIGECFRRV